MKNLNQINEIMESLRYAATTIDAEDIPYISEMMLIAVKFDSEYAGAYAKLHEIFKHVVPSETTEVDVRTPEAEEATTETPVEEPVEEPADETPVEETAEESEDMDFREVEVEVPTPTPEPETPIIFQHPDYSTIGAGTDGQVYIMKDSAWKKADTRSVYFPRKKDGTWGRVERQEILDLLNNYNTSAWDEPADAVEEKETEYDRLPDGYFIHPTHAVLAANEDGKILKQNKNGKWTVPEIVTDNRGCTKIKGTPRIGVAKCVYECINKHAVKQHVRYLNGDPTDNRFSNLTAYGDANYHKFQMRTYGIADVIAICEYICKHNGDVTNISKDTKGKYSVYYAKKILCKEFHSEVSDRYFTCTPGGVIYINKEAK